MKLCYADQQGPCIGRISEDIDVNYVEEREQEAAEQEGCRTTPEKCDRGIAYAN